MEYLIMSYLNNPFLETRRGFFFMPDIDLRITI